ncbi:hypothetical protein GQ457_10G010470 [Hibiscus cannabinus]
MHGRSESTLKKHNWALIDCLCDVSPLPWLLGGDFNEILTLSEKQGGSRKPHHQLTDFRECLLRNNLTNCKPSRGWFTWMQLGPQWFSCFPTFRAWSEFSPNSDHHFILFDIAAGAVPSEPGGKNATFRFDACWAHEPDCVTLVQTLWWQNSKRLTDWGCILELRSEINRLSSWQLSPGELEVLLAAKGELCHLLNLQEVYWAQRSRLFSAGPSIEVSAFLEYITPSVSDAMNSALSADFTPEEVISTFRDINPQKSPGIDGLPSGFFRQHWDILCDAFISLCLDLLRGQIDMATVNEIVIVLIPKVDKPTSMWQLYPISLCTVICKTIAKVLVNRMKSILPSCISNTQAAFVQWPPITDNILVAHEIFHTLHTSTSRSSEGAVFKLDMEKAFDRVQWPFLRAVMLHLGFVPSWVDLIMRCVSSVSSQVRVRGTISAPFLPQRGLRQGDPLSPFLFLFCTEGLSATLLMAQREGHLLGVRASKHGPPINHLLFADDSLFFLRNDISEVQCLKDILTTYSTVSGQNVNFAKSTAYFSPRTPSEHWLAVHVALGVQEVSDPGIYLGVPLFIGKKKYTAFGRYRDKMDTRVSKWSNLLLSFSGREVLIKSIAQATPQYVMSCYLLPSSLVEEMSISICRFWWSGKGSACGWPFVAWVDLCKPKAAGGMGFKDLHLFNLALLGKQHWRLLSVPGSLLYRTLRAKYFPDGDLVTPQFLGNSKKKGGFQPRGFELVTLAAISDGLTNWAKTQS